MERLTKDLNLPEKLGFLFVHSYVESDLDKNEYNMVIDNLVNLVDPELDESDEDDNDQENEVIDNDQDNAVIEIDQDNAVSENGPENVVTNDD